MSKKKYSEMVDSPVEITTDESTEYLAETVEDAVDEEVAPTVEEEVAPTVVEVIKGVVVDCTELNVRKAPEANAEVVSKVKASTEVIIDEAESTDEFYKICTAVGVEGFCMRRFINVLK